MFSGSVQLLEPEPKGGTKWNLIRARLHPTFLSRQGPSYVAYPFQIRKIEWGLALITFHLVPDRTESQTDFVLSLWDVPLIFRPSSNAVSTICKLTKMPRGLNVFLVRVKGPERLNKV